MKSTFTFGAIVLLATLAAGEARAEQPATRPADRERPGMVMLARIHEQMVADLNLTAAQKDKIETIFRDARSEMETLRPQLEDLAPRDRMERVGEFFRGVREDLSKVLNDEQRAVFNKKMDEARERFRAGAANRPTTGPAGAAPGPDGRRPGQQFLERMRDAIPKLDLSDAQKAKIKDLMDDVKKKGDELRQQVQGGSDEARDKIRELMQETRQKLITILTPEQQQKFREMMRAQDDPGGAPPAADAANNSGNPPGAFGPKGGGFNPKRNRAAPASKPSADANGMMDEMTGGSSEKAIAKVDDAPPQSPTIAMVGLSPGQTAPSFDLRKLDNSLVQLSSLKGRVVVLVFGSYTCPAFRQRVAAIEKLKSEYGTRAQFFIVYGREAHAIGEWEVDRNKADGISIEQPKTLEARRSLAQTARDNLKITTPILIDTIDNTTATAYGAAANSAYVIDRDGTLLARQEWFDPTGIRRVIDQAVAANRAATTKPAA